MRKYLEVKRTIIEVLCESIAFKKVSKEKFPDSNNFQMIIFEACKKLFSYLVLSNFVEPFQLFCAIMNMILVFVLLAFTRFICKWRLNWTVRWNYEKSHLTQQNF